MDGWKDKRLIHYVEYSADSNLTGFTAPTVNTEHRVSQATAASSRQQTPATTL